MSGFLAGAFQPSGFEVGQPPAALLGAVQADDALAAGAFLATAALAGALQLDDAIVAGALMGTASLRGAVFVEDSLAAGLFGESVTVPTIEITLVQARQYLDMALGIALPDFMVQAAIDRVSQYSQALADAGYSPANQLMAQCMAVAIVAAVGAPRRLTSQHAPSGASRGFSYTRGDLSDLRRALASLDPLGILSGVVGADPAAASFMMVV